jgi:hypothetical protein
MYGLFLKARRANSCAGRMIVAVLFMAAAIFVTLPIVAQEGAAQEGKEFIAGIEDLPVMPGLAEIADAGLIFDKPSGRIVEAYAQGEVGEQAVLDFYQETLPQLGWLSQVGNRYAREGEELTLQVRASETGGVVVMFRLAPK